MLIHPPVGGVSISGVGGWLAAAILIWLASMLAGFILKVTIAKRIIEDVRD